MTNGEHEHSLPTVSETVQHTVEPNGHRGIRGRLEAFVELTHPVAVAIWFAATVLFSFVAAKGPPPLDLLVRVVIVVVASQICIGTMNEFCDQTVDKEAKPWRPIPSGRVAPRTALLIAIIALVLSIAVASSLGVVGIGGSLLGTGAGLAHDFGVRRTVLSWLPFVVGYTLHPIWIWSVLEHFQPMLLLLSVTAAPLIFGLHLADQLPDVVHGDPIHSGIGSRLGPQHALAVTGIALGVGPGVMLLPVLPRLGSYPGLLYVPGVLAFYGLLGGAVILYLRGGRGYRALRLGWMLVELGTLILITLWLAAAMWS